MKKTFSSCLELLGFKLFGQKFLRDEFRIWAKISSEFWRHHAEKSFFKLANPGLFFVYFRTFHNTIRLQIEKAYMLCMGFELGAAVW